MATYALPVLYTLLLWWASTGVILYLDGLDRRTFVWSMAGATVLLGISLWGAAVDRRQLRPRAAPISPSPAGSAPGDGSSSVSTWDI